MMMFIPLLCLASLILAEPPIGDGYPVTRLSQDHHHVPDHNDLQDQYISDHQRSLPQEYEPLSSTSAHNYPTGYSTNKIDYPNARAQSRFRPASVHVSFNQRFGSFGTRRSGKSHNNIDARNPSQNYAGNSRRDTSQEYSPYASRSLSEDYGVPTIGSTLSSEYGVPYVKSSPSQEYGAPVLDARRSNEKSHSSASNYHSKVEKDQSQDYSLPATRFQVNSQSEDYKNSARSKNVEQSYNAPKSDFGFRSVPSSKYGTPSDRSLSYAFGDSSARSSGTQNYGSSSQTYGAPSQKDPSESYDTPNLRSLSQEYGLLSDRINLKTDDYAASSASSRSPSPSTYFSPSRDTMPSQQYGLPEHDDQGYENARNLNELLNQEPASYNFLYEIEDHESGNDFGHTETREENRAHGSYFVVLPDGRKQTVEYEADESGFKPRISVQPATGGYDDNAADTTRSNGGPY